MIEQTIEDTACNMCGEFGPHRIVLRKTDDPRRSVPIALIKCRTCGGISLSSIPESFDDELYSYYEAHKSKASDVLYPELTRSRYMDLLKLWEPMVSGRRILDVGCGVGGFVEAALARQWSAEGIDLAKAAIAIGREYKLPVSEIDFFSTEIEANSRDVITMFEFIEHVPLPRDFLAQAGRVLKPGGLLYITTPNFDSLDRLFHGSAWGVIHNEHLSYFTRKTLRNIISGIDTLELVDVRTKNISAEAIRKILCRKSAGSLQNDDICGEDIRGQIEKSGLLRNVKSLINVVLNATGLGSTMTMTIRKRNNVYYDRLSGK